MKLLFWAALSAALIGCAALPSIGNVISGTATEKNTPGNLYRYRGELLVTVDGKSFEGMAVTKLTGPVTIHVESKFALDRLQFTSCGRQDVIRDFDNSWFSKSKTYDYQYSPDKKELSGQCALYIEAFNKANLAAWAYVAFRSDETFPARMECNGVDWKFSGLSVCQTKAGLDQSIIFDKSVVDFEADPLCGLKKIDDKNFDLRPGLGLCVAAFYDGQNWHTLNMIGYERVLVQGE
ncbi:MAG: hypothetical protein ACXWQE_00015 [Bdellovibrionales bacterium]